MSVLKYKDPVTGEWKTINTGYSAGGNLPTALPNPFALTINGKTYDGSEAVDITVGGGSVSESSLLGQTPFTTSAKTAIKLVGKGEHTYTIRGKTIADLSTITASASNATLTQQDGFIQIATTAVDGDWFKPCVTLLISGLTAGTSYIFAVQGLGLDTTNLISNGYYLVRSSNGTELGRINADSIGTNSVEFVADTANITILCYPANNYYWTNNYRTARIADLYLNKASDGTERTDVIDQSGSFTDSYVAGTVSKGVTVTATPACEIHSISSSNAENYALPLSDQTIVCFGDSLFGMHAGETSAPAYVARRTGATVHNVGFGGCRMSVHPYAGYNEFCMYALASAVASGDWSLQDAAASNGSSNFPDQLAILKGIDFSTVDAIVIHYGTNDFTGSAAIGKDSEPSDCSTLCGALRYSIETLLNAYPQLRIFVSLPAFRYWVSDDGTITDSESYTNSKGNTLPEFVSAIAEVAKEYNLPVIDSYYGLGINKINAHTFLSDGVHHSIEGRKRFGSYIGSRLMAEY